MSQAWNGMLTKLRRFDAYPKTLEDFRVKTFSGAAVTVISSIIMGFLFLSELKYYLTTDVVDELYVDMSRGDKLRINVDFTMHYLPCAYVTLDAMDVSGQRQINVHTTLYKQRLGKDGSPVDESAEKVELVTKKANDTAKTVGENECGSCYGAETKEMMCCNTCDDVRTAYNKKGWAFPKGNLVKQCETEMLVETMEMQSGEGCQLHGYLEVNRVAGNFHVSPGKSYEMGHMHVHDMAAFGKEKYNLSHTINHLSFGENYPGQVFPLDGHKVLAEVHDMVFQYYVKIVPTTYVKLSGDVLKTNQFSITKHQKELTAEGESSLPGIFMSYELSPMMVRYVEKRRSFFHFLTSVCAIIGGVFTVAGLIDSFIYHGGRALQRKIDLGKAT